MSTPTHNYMKKIQRMIRRGQLRPDCDVSTLQVLHDVWCPALHGGRCSCDPDIEARPVYRRGQEN